MAGLCQPHDLQNHLNGSGQSVGFSIVTGWLEKAEAILLGCTTYEMMYPYWSQVTGAGGFAVVDGKEVG